MDEKNEGIEICVVCCREILIYAVGSCDHHVCFECSSRMRVLCKQNECPICRSDMPLVIFSKKKQAFSEFFDYDLHDQKYRIVFEDEEVVNAFYKLLEHRCPKCNNVFDKFSALDKHVRREHSLHYCNVCVENLKLFSFERRCYDRKDLALHNRKGDIDDKSHKGHPMCDSCQVRYIDYDELYRHLRKEHFFCHFCDADGQNIFFEDYEFLQNHFRQKHFLCEEGDCAKDRFVGAFRTEIDLRAHRAKNHTKNKTKAEVKQDRTLNLEFNYASRHEGERGRNTNHFRRRNIDEDVRNNASTAESSNASERPVPFSAFVQDFPLLSNEGTGASRECKIPSNSYSSCVSSIYKPFTSKQKNKKNGAVPTEDFPALSSPVPNSNLPAPPKWQTFSQHIQSAMESPKSKSASQKQRGQKKKPLNMSDFPQLDPSTSIESEPSQVTKPWKQTCEEALLAQQIALKCKAKSKTEQAVRNNYVNQINEPSKPLPEVNDDPVPMALAYGGLSKHNPSDDPKKKLSEEKFAQMELKNKLSNMRKKDPYEDIPWYEPVKLSLNDDGDFPPLDSNGFKGPPGFEKPLPRPRYTANPPGFSENSGFQSTTNTNTNTNISLSSIAQQLTLESISKPLSADESSLASPMLMYQQPVDFQERNNILYSKLTELIEQNNKTLNEFKLLSGNFRRGKISAKEYHSACLKILGKDKFFQIFSELLCLLPDIQKQQELLSVHEEFLKEESKVRGAVPRVNRSFITCCTCSQVLSKHDLTNHQILHKNAINGFRS